MTPTEIQELLLRVNANRPADRTKDEEALAAALRQTLEELEGVRGQLAGASDALNRFCQHRTDCALWSAGGSGCSCGLSQAIHALASKEPDADPAPYCLHCGPKSACTRAVPAVQPKEK